MGDVKAVAHEVEAALQILQKEVCYFVIIDKSRRSITYWMYVAVTADIGACGCLEWIPSTTQVSVLIKRLAEKTFILNKHFIFSVQL